MFVRNALEEPTKNGSIYHGTKDGNCHEIKSMEHILTRCNEPPVYRYGTWQDDIVHVLAA